MSGPLKQYFSDPMDLSSVAALPDAPQRFFSASEGVRPPYTVSVLPAMLLPCSNAVDVKARTKKASELTIVKLIASTAQA